MTLEELSKSTDIQRISDEGQKIYDSIKTKYLPADEGRFLAIEIDSQEVFLGDSSVEVIEAARRAHPDKLFYVVKIGHSAVETLSRLAAV